MAREFDPAQDTATNPHELLEQVVQCVNDIVDCTEAEEILTPARVRQTVTLANGKRYTITVTEI